MTRNARLVMAALALQAGAAPLFAQGPARAPGFGGGAMFIAPHLGTNWRAVQVRGEAQIGWGAAAEREGSAELSARALGTLRLSAHWTGARAETDGEQRSDRVFGFTVAHPRVALTVGARRQRAAVDEYSTDLDGIDVRLGVPVGTPLGLHVALASSTSDVVHRGNTQSTRTVVVAGYEFVSTRRVEFLEASQHRDLELEVSGVLGPLRVGGFVGRGFSDGAAPDRAWAYGRVAAPLGARLELVAEAGRNGGVPAIGRVPQRFARLGVRMDLNAAPAPLATIAPIPAAAVRAIVDVQDEPRIIIAAPGAARVEVKGDFTAWEAVPMLQLGEGRWSVAVPEGVVRFNVRVDAHEWSVPAGVPAVPDEFSGAPVAVVVVRRGS